MMYLFPFEQVNRGEKVLIYGYGTIGKSYIPQIDLTNYCQLIGVVDQKAASMEADDCRLMEPGEIKNVEFDKIVIALSDKSPCIVDEVKKNLEDMGIPKWKIIFPRGRGLSPQKKIPTVSRPSFSDNILHVGVQGCGGLGDAVLTLPLLSRIKSLLGSRAEITFITQYAEMFYGNEIVDYAITDIEDRKFDILFQNMHLPLIISWNPEKVKRISSKLDEYWMSVIKLQEQYAQDISGDRLWHFARVLGKRRFDVCDLKNILNVGIGKIPLLLCVADSTGILNKYNLLESDYITVNRDVDILSNMSNFKLWTTEYYSECLSMIKRKFDNLKIVRIGFRESMDGMKNVDVDLSGKTGLGELMVLLRNSKLLISSEGGLVHVNHFLGGRSAVVYGPTDEAYFGYEDDIICVNRLPCKIPCQYVPKNTQCPRGFEIPQCIKNVTPQLVFDNIASYL